MENMERLEIELEQPLIIGGPSNSFRNLYNKGKRVLQSIGRDVKETLDNKLLDLYFMGGCISDVLTTNFFLNHIRNPDLSSPDVEKNPIARYFMTRNSWDWETGLYLSEIPIAAIILSSSILARKFGPKAVKTIGNFLGKETQTSINFGKVTLATIGSLRYLQAYQNLINLCE